jgi:hypothetical protein
VVDFGLARTFAAAEAAFLPVCRGFLGMITFPFAPLCAAAQNVMACMPGCGTGRHVQTAVIV